MFNGIVIPCYNEADRLRFEDFRAFIAENPNYLLCFVNDGSKDATLSQLEAFAQDQEQVIVLDLAQNSGKAEAVRQGVQRLLAEEVQTIGFLDADLATGFEDYKRLIHTIRMTNKDVVIGSRKMNNAEAIDRSAFRKFASWVMGKFINLIIGMPINDTQCGAKVFRANIAKKVFAQGFMSRWLFDVEIFIRLKQAYGKNAINAILELGVNSWEEVEGSKITLKDSLKFPLELIDIGLSYNVKPQIDRILYGTKIPVPDRAA